MPAAPRVRPRCALCAQTGSRGAASGARGSPRVRWPGIISRIFCGRVWRRVCSPISTIGEIDPCRCPRALWRRYRQIPGNLSMVATGNRHDADSRFAWSWRPRGITAMAGGAVCAGCRLHARPTPTRSRACCGTSESARRVRHPGRASGARRRRRMAAGFVTVKKCGRPVSTGISSHVHEERRLSEQEAFPWQPVPNRG